MWTMRVGDKWAALECVEAGMMSQEETSLDADGKPYVSKVMRVAGYRLRCGCGQVVFVARHNWRGKRVMRDCGCGAAGMSGAAVIMSFTLPGPLREQLEVRAREERQTLSWVLNQALMRYLDGAGSGAGVGGDVGGVGWGESV